MPLTQAAAILVDRHPAGPALELVLRAPGLARQLAPGQPVLVKPGPTLSPYLRRTFYPVALGAEDFTIRIPPSPDWGNAWLRVAPVGAEVDCMGPVGNGFSIQSGVRNVLCVGLASGAGTSGAGTGETTREAGTGADTGETGTGSANVVGSASSAGAGPDAWSLLPLISWADAAGLSVTFVAAAQSTRGALPAARLPASVEYHLVTSDGRPDLVRPLISTLSDLLPWADALCAALPVDAYIALAETVRMARYALSRGFAQAIYPAQFLCGTGACLSCVADVAGGRRRVCLRGPVFDLVDIVGPQRD